MTQIYTTSFGFVNISITHVIIIIFIFWLSVEYDPEGWQTLDGGGIDYNGDARHISDTRTMRLEIYYADPQAGRTLLWDSFARRFKLLLRTNIHRWIETLLMRITVV